MHRRAFLGGLLAAIPAAHAHTPYGQWVTYRRKHLLIGCHKKDPETYVLAKAMVAKFEHLLPEASARVARAPSLHRIASLMGTEQLDVAILAAEDAAEMARGEGMFKPYGPIALGLLAALGEGKVMISRANFRADHAWLVSAAAHESGLVAGDEGAVPVTWHTGAADWRAKRAMPDPVK